MKSPKARQLPSGAWFCRVRIDGKDIGITRPTEKEAIARIKQVSLVKRMIDMYSPEATASPNESSDLSIPE